MNTHDHDSIRRILVIDDNRAIHGDFAKILAPPDEVALDAQEASIFGDDAPAQTAGRFEISSAYQGTEGVEVLRRAHEEGRPFAMAFVDVRMPPGIDGIETVALLWKIAPDLQVVICTAYSDYSWQETIEKLGNSDRLLILRKPFDTMEALQLAHALTEKWRLLQQVKVKIEDMQEAIESRAAELAKSEERFRLIAENAGDLIAVWDGEGTRIYSSPSYEKVLGFPPAEWSGTPPCTRIHPDDQEGVRQAVQAAVGTGAGQVIEHRIQHSDGSWRVLESHVSPVRGMRGEAGHLVAVARDITQRKKQEEERRQMELQLRHAQKMESIGQLAAGIAHEINTPTQYIGDNTQFVQEGFQEICVLLGAHGRLLEAAKRGAVTPELVAEVDAAAVAADVAYLSVEIPKAIAQSIQGVQRVSKIVGAMKDFSHPGSTEKSAIDLNRAIESTLTVATNEWRYVAEMVTDFDPALPLVPCLPGEFNQVILNMVVNASHAIADVVGDGSRGKGKISVSPRTRGESVEIRIGDTGSGIPEEIRRKIFDPFFTTKGVGKGTGQGLAIAHSVVADKHGGHIELESEVGKGSTFVILLPLRPTTLEKEAA